MRARGRPTGGGTGAGPGGGPTLGGQDLRLFSPGLTLGGDSTLSHTSAHPRRAGPPCAWGVVQKGQRSIQGRRSPQGAGSSHRLVGSGAGPGAGAPSSASGCGARTLRRDSIRVDAAGCPVGPTGPCGESAASLEGARAPRGGHPVPAGEGAPGVPRPVELDVLVWPQSLPTPDTRIQGARSISSMPMGQALLVDSGGLAPDSGDPGTDSGDTATDSGDPATDSGRLVADLGPCR